MAFEDECMKPVSLKRKTIQTLDLKIFFCEVTSLDRCLLFKGAVCHFGEAQLLSCSKLDEKIDTSIMSMRLYDGPKTTSIR